MNHDLKNKREVLRICAIKSLHASGQKSGFFPEKLEKGENGQPLPSNNVFWSISHKDEYAGGLVSKSIAGIDVEIIKNISLPLFNRIVSQKEKKCFKTDEDKIVFFRCFTAKEAVLKALGVGLVGLSYVSVIKVEDSLNMLLRYKNKEYKVEHIFFDKYIASVVKDDSKDTYKVEWCID
ncbi:MAG: 4'-phosphopantetheinyl transferase superfamily protein [Desulfobacteraceae bacterium]|nr:4'-phosphopantetheinyl transferase superfamily protein [Desulfobacteraceae bacterium]